MQPADLGLHSFQNILKFLRKKYAFLHSCLISEHMLGVVLSAIFIFPDVIIHFGQQARFCYLYHRRAAESQLAYRKYEYKGKTLIRIKTSSTAEEVNMGINLRYLHICISNKISCAGLCFLM